MGLGKEETLLAKCGEDSDLILEFGPGFGAGEVDLWRGGDTGPVGVGSRENEGDSE